MLAVMVIGVSLLVLTSGVVYAKPQGWTTIGTHVVRPGETIWCIARGYGVSPTAIAAQNGLVSPSLIKPGQKLLIPDLPATLPTGPVCTRQFGDDEPSPPSLCTCEYFRTVAPGSNLYRISLQYGVGMWRIAECNGVLNLNLIRAGSVLCIPEG
jgi:LysM repeat protein